MFKNSHSFEIPWAAHGHHEDTEPHRHLWWLIALLVLLAIFLTGVSVTYGIL
ncbi:MAG: hypothetical protein ABI604_07395 [Nitrospirota bacterium]